MERYFQYSMRTMVTTNKEEVLNFSLQIEDIVEKKRIPYMDAIIEFCEKKELEIEVAAKLLSPPIKARLKIEAENLHFLPKNNTNRLPI